MAVKSMPVGLERLITMADTEREKRKKVFEDFMKPYKKEDKKAKKEDKKDKKEREKSLRAADRKAAELDRYLALGDTGMTFAEYEKSLRAADRKAAELDRYLADRDKEGDFNKGGVVKRKKKPKVTKKTYSRGSRKANYNG